MSLPPVEYVTVRGVPLLDDHVLRNREGTTHIDERFLHEVARNNNERFRRTGDATPICIGHTRDGVPETHQPPVIGYANNFRVERFGRDADKVALVADFHVRKERESALRDYPRRSVELWVSRREVDPIALLGATTPERDLGVLRYSRDAAEQVVLIESPHEDEPMPAPRQPSRYAADDAAQNTRTAEQGETSGARESGDKLDRVISMLQDLPGQIAQALAAMVQGQGQGGGGGEEDLLEPEDRSQGGAAAGGGREQAEQYSFGGNGGYVPTTAEQYARYEQIARGGFAQPAAGVYPPPLNGEVVRLQRQVEELSRGGNDLRAKLSRMEAEKVIAALEGERVVFADREHEIKVLEQLGPKEQDSYAEHIRKNYQRRADPTQAGGVSRFARSAADAGGPQTHEEVQDAISKLPAGLSPAEAIARVYSGGTRR